MTLNQVRPSDRITALSWPRERRGNFVIADAATDLSRLCQRAYALPRRGSLRCKSLELCQLCLMED